MTVGSERGAPSAAGDDDLLAGDRPAARAQARDAAGLVLDRLDLDPELERVHRRRERAHHRARLGLGVLGREDAPCDPRGEPGLELAAARRSEPLDGEAELALELVKASQLAGVVGVGRHDERAGLAIARRQAG